MKATRKQILTALAAAGLTIVLLLAGQYLWHKVKIEQPISQLLKTQNVAKTWNFKYDSGKVLIQLSLKKVDNFSASYQKITNALDQQLGSGNYTIEIKNLEQSKLSNFYQSIQPIMFEGLTTGKYTWMVEKIQADAERKGLTAKMQFDQTNLFLQITDQVNGYYLVMPRYSEDTGKLVFNQ